jgi:hypothetical protein
MRRDPEAVLVPVASVVLGQEAAPAVPAALAVPVVGPEDVPVPVVGRVVSVGHHVARSDVVVAIRTSCSRSTSR